MRVLVIGAGIVGQIYGWALAESGHRVVHLVRPGRAAALRDGQPIDVYDRRKGHKHNFRGVYKLFATESLSPADTFDWVIVPVKHYDLAEALEEIVPRAGAADFLLLTQNWLGTADIDAVLPRARYVFGDAKAGGTFSEGVLVAALSAIDIGPPEGQLTALAHKAADLFRSADISTRLHSDMLHYLWIQYATTGGLWTALIQAGGFDAIFSDPAAGRAAFQAGRECLDVVKQRGVVLSAYPDAKPFLTNSALLRRFFMGLMRWMFLHWEYPKRCSAHAFGDPLEVATFYDDLIGTGHRLGVSMPVMESYSEAIRRFAANEAVLQH